LTSLCALVLSIAAPAGGVLLAAEPAGPRGLEAEVRRLIAGHARSDASLEGADIAVAVIDHAGREVVRIRADEPMKPASNLKVLTTAAALHLLGPEHRFETTVTADAPLRDGVIRGDVVVRGTGDPNISGRFFGGNPTSLFRSWARGLRSAGLRRIEGDLIADDTYFDDVRLQPTWDLRQAEAWYSAEISALSLNDNCADVTVRPGSRPGERASIKVAPASSLVRIEGSASTVTRGTRVILHRKPGTNLITVSGRIQAGGPPWTGNITIHDPALFFVRSLARVLDEEGISIAGKARRIERPGATAAAAPAYASAPGEPAEILIRHASTLLQDLPVINKRSQNLHAEMLLKSMGARLFGDGSLAGGERAVRKFLRERGIPAETLVLADGSGLSHANRLSASLLARVLHAARSMPCSREFLESLPVAGEDGTLDDRFRQSPELRGMLHAKTGYIARVSCLSGYVRRGTRVWSFSILTNGLGAGARGAKRLQERIAERIHAAMTGG
jgi:D-alanyl-D-alanine carboxypeptidase/D-alanyl-D-alanine-endopeptidase (penicillin-binding protein 4)